MAQVSTQAELQAALNAMDSAIQITSAFSITSQLNIRYAVTIESPAPDNPVVLTKDSSYFTYLFRVMDGGALTLKNVILDGGRNSHPADDSNNRSLIYVTDGTLNLLDGTIIRNNNSYLEGGGVYLNSSTGINTLNMSGSARITNCYSRTSGGGLMIASGNADDKYTITGTAQIDNCLAANGGGLYFRIYTEGVGGSLSLGDQIQITNNIANSTGGGIAFSGYRNGGSPAASLTLTGNALVSDNRAFHGAGVYFYAANAQDSFTLSENALITQNTASQNGGGLNMSANGSSANINIDRGGITKNVAGTGGGMYVLTDSGADMTFEDANIIENAAVNGDSGSGGGIWMQNQSQTDNTAVAFTDTTLNNNRSSAHGGGVALYGGSGPFTFQMTGGSISENQCNKNGAGLLISSEDTATLTFYQADILKNTAGGSGGGMYYANVSESSPVSCTMTDTVISDNTAGTEGGGLRLSSGTASLTTTLTDCTLLYSTASTNSGGGIWNGGKNNLLTLTGTTTVAENSSKAGNGGGIYFNSENGNILLTDNVKIINNNADAVSTDFGNHGGGICLVPGILTIRGQAVISGNHAGKYGGGISAAENSRIVMEGGSISENISGQMGGGIWNSGGSTVTLTGGLLFGNQAPSGSGIYNNSTLYVEGGRDISNGIYIEDRSAVIYLNNALDAGSAIQLEGSPYVSPNETGMPIVIGEATPAYPTLTQTDADAFRKPVQNFDNWAVELSEDHTQILLVRLPQYTLTFDGNDSCRSRACCIPEPLTAYQGGSLTLPDIIPERRGFCFKCWNTDSCGCGEEYLPGALIPSLNQDLTLYAIWCRKGFLRYCTHPNLK